MSESQINKSKILLLFKKQAYKSLLSKNKNSEQTYYFNIIDNIIFNERTHVVSLFKDYLILDDDYEFLKRFYTIYESIPRIVRAVDYYNKYDLFYPNYSALPESNLLFNNILRKQNIIDNIQREKKNAEKKKENNEIKDNNDIIFNSSIYDYIINQSSNTLSIFDLDKEKNEGTISELNNLINNINNNSNSNNKNIKNINQNNSNNNNENKIIIRNIMSNRTMSYCQSNSAREQTLNNKNINLVTSKVYKKNTSLIKNKNNFFRCSSKVNIKNNGNENNVKNDEPLKFIYSNKKIINENNIFSIPKLLQKDYNSSTINNNNSINYNPALSYSVNRAKGSNKCLYTKNKLIKTDTRTFDKKNLVKCISESNFHNNNNIKSFATKIQTPNKLIKEPRYYYQNIKNNNNLSNNIVIKEHLFTEETAKIKVNMKQKRNCKPKNQKLVIDLTEWQNNKSKKMTSKKNYKSVCQGMLYKKQNPVLYKKKYVNNNSNNTYENQMNNNSISVNDIIYLHTATDDLNKEKSSTFASNFRLFKSIYDKSHSPIYSENKKYNKTINYLVDCTPINYANTIQNEAPYSKKKIIKNNSLNTLTKHKRKNNNLGNSIENIHQNIIKANNNNKNIHGSNSLCDINKQKNPLNTLSLWNLNKCIYNNNKINKTIDNNKNCNMDIFNSIMNREKVKKIYDDYISYTDLNVNDNLEKNKTYINININNNIDINNKNNGSTDPNYYSTEENTSGGIFLKNKKIFNKTINNNTSNNKNRLNIKLQKVKEWRNKQISEIIRESRLKYFKINSSSNFNNDFKMRNSGFLNFSNNEGKNMYKVKENLKNIKNLKSSFLRNNNSENALIIKNNFVNKNKIK